MIDADTMEEFEALKGESPDVSNDAELREAEQMAKAYVEAVRRKVTANARVLAALAIFDEATAEVQAIWERMFTPEGAADVSH